MFDIDCQESFPLIINFLMINISTDGLHYDVQQRNESFLLMVSIEKTFLQQ